MAIKVDPFIRHVPKAFRSDPETLEFFTYLIRWAHDIWRRTGGGDDSVDNLNTREIYPWINEGDDIRSMSFNYLLEEKKQEIISITASHTTVGSEIVICNNTSPITVTLNANPDHAEDVIIKRMGSSVTVISTHGIDGETIKQIKYKYDSPRLLFTDEAGEFSII